MTAPLYPPDPRDSGNSGDALPREGDLAPMEVEAPRRAASAQFIVDDGASAQASLRAAMDPANQSFADALRLSYRVLQLVMVVLIGVFLFSGFQNVEEGRVGVRTLFGKIHGAAGEQQVSPGLTPFWPYPVGEIVTVSTRRTFDMSRAFWPSYPRGVTTLEQATEQASATNPLQPGIRPSGDGLLLTANGDIAHLGLTVEATVDDAVKFLENVSPAVADALVQRIVRRATVHVAAARTLTELIDVREEPPMAIRDLAQQTLQELGTGVSIVSVTLPARSAPLAVRRAFTEVQNAREDAKTTIEQARQTAEEDLTRAAGGNYQAFLALIDKYEDLMAERRVDEAEEALDELARAMDDRAASGEVTRIVARARSYQSQIESTLGADAARFASLLPIYEKDPDLLIRQLWFDAVADALNQPRLEIMPIPADLGQLVVRASSSIDVMNERRRAEIERKRLEADMDAIPDSPYLLRGRDITIGAPGRRLDRTARTRPNPR